MKKSILLLLIFTHLISCKSNDTITNSATVTTGDLVGTVELIDVHNNPLTNHSGVLVRIEGTTFSATSDSLGRWVIHDLPSKTYAITFSKPGFYSRHDKSFTFVAGEPVRYRDVHHNLDYIVLGPIPEFTITLDAITMPTRKIIDGKVFDDYGLVFAHTSNNAPANTYVGMYLLASRNPNLRIEDWTTVGIAEPYSVPNPSVQDSSVDLSGTLTYIVYAIFAKPGDTVYFKAYPILSPIFEYDAITGTEMLIGYSPRASNVLSGVME
jgi:hypothetical protein